MGDASEYQKRAEQCAARAQTLTRADDRARWLQLSEEWTALSRIRFLKMASTDNQPAGLWRGEAGGGSGPKSE